MSPESSEAAPIGVFDSGVGGLSVLRALQAELPHEHFVYLADNGHAPYGERGDAFVAARTHAIAGHLRRAHGIKALVVACNTATAAAIHEARASHPGLPVVGVEPALKPAVAATRTGRVGVIATRGTLASGKFGRLLDSLRSQAEFIVQPCDGLAHAIEQAVAEGLAGATAAAEIEALCTMYMRAMGRFGTETGAIDTLVLGCTHYVFAESVLQRLAGHGVRLVETGEPVARQTRRLLAQAGLLASAPGGGALQLLTTGDPGLPRAAAARWLRGPARQSERVDVPAVPPALPARRPG
ncbi:glutamate racemase [Ottowia sp.]|jgi:glutamate racemase|uniref:glutamate racemase n=1 Tax=Ottowia sp. TaxID=1898956 RepID=UPI0025DE2E8F|nr:glutamate racemase [Ottowia sp.]MBK6615281.1 glutamate racemase [Ottowia sp.]MBK6746354.1 glutamate racemase [Ottowia sp.]